MANASVDFHPEAVIEGAAAHAWYTERSQVAAAALATELDRAVSEITEQPTRWPRYLYGTRRYLLRRFPYAIVYREKAGSVLVVAFAHSSRLPGYWKNR